MVSCGQPISERSRTDPLYFLSSEDHKRPAAWDVAGWIEANSQNDVERNRLGRFVLDRIEKGRDAENTYVLLHYASFLDAAIQPQDEEPLRKAIAKANSVHGLVCPNGMASTIVRARWLSNHWQ
jgi:hypothetical protein